MLWGHLSFRLERRHANRSCFDITGSKMVASLSYVFGLEARRPRNPKPFKFQTDKNKAKSCLSSCPGGVLCKLCMDEWLLTAWKKGSWPSIINKNNYKTHQTKTYSVYSISFWPCFEILQSAATFLRWCPRRLSYGLIRRSGGAVAMSMVMSEVGRLQIVNGALRQPIVRRQ